MNKSETYLVAFSHRLPTPRFDLDLRLHSTNPKINQHIDIHSNLGTPTPTCRKKNLYLTRQQTTQTRRQRNKRVTSSTAAPCRVLSRCISCRSESRLLASTKPQRSSTSNRLLPPRSVAVADAIARSTAQRSRATYNTYAKSSHPYLSVYRFSLPRYIACVVYIYVRTFTRFIRSSA